MEIDYDTLYCFVDDFSKAFEPWYKKQLIADNRIKRNRNGQLSLAEILTILITYHQSGMSCFKYFYFHFFKLHQHLFPGLVHYTRFVKLIKRTLPALACLLKSLEGEITEYLFIDSTPMAVCHNLRERKHKTFKGLAAKGKTSTGWFFGMKIHIIFNTKGEIIRLVITPGNVSDKKPVRHMVKGLKAKLIGDKGYLSKRLFQDLFAQGVTLITKIKKNMKNCLMNIRDKLMLMRRSFIETIFSSLKALNTLIHHRHRCPIN
ncbi:MAG: IS982 family transposase, partial [Alphaproteobacteria bacterium]|nr:IS982 family transposase [Alphaproteobacteria bacterium]